MIIKVSPTRILNTDNLKKIEIYCFDGEIKIGWGNPTKICDHNSAVIINTSLIPVANYQLVTTNLMQLLIDKLICNCTYFDLDAACCDIVKKVNLPPPPPIIPYEERDPATWGPLAKLYYGSEAKQKFKGGKQKDA